MFNQEWPPTVIRVDIVVVGDVTAAVATELGCFRTSTGVRPHPTDITLTPTPPVAIETIWNDNACIQLLMMMRRMRMIVVVVVVVVAVVVVAVVVVAVVVVMMTMTMVMISVLYYL